jgi:hypothetical protein
MRDRAPPDIACDEGEWTIGVMAEFVHHDQFKVLGVLAALVVLKLRRSADDVVGLF